jgi:hypothetical protein
MSDESDEQENKNPSRDTSDSQAVGNPMSNGPALQGTGNPMSNESDPRGISLQNTTNYGQIVVGSGNSLNQTNFQPRNEPAKATSGATPNQPPTARRGNQADIQITGDQYGRLCDALVDAFPRREDLRQMVKFQLDANLESIAGSVDLKSACFDLVQWAESHGRLADLIRGACRGNLGNSRVRDIATELGF